MAWTKALLRGLFDLDVDGVGKESFRTSFPGRGHWLWVLKVFELAAPPHADIFTARFLSEMESLVLLAFKLLDKRYQTLIRWTMRSCAYGVVMCNCASFTEYATTRTEGFPAHRGRGKVSAEGPIMWAFQ